MSLQTVHKSIDQMHTIAFDDRSGKFFLCRYNFDTGKYAKLHRHGSDYETVVFLSQSVYNHSNHSINWEFEEELPTPISLFDYLESLPPIEESITPARSSILSRVFAFVGSLIRL
jgi:hypothetical protein